MTSADPVVVSRSGPIELRGESMNVHADLFAEVAAQRVRGIAEAIGKVTGCGIQQNSCRVDAARTDDHPLCWDHALLARMAVEVLDPACPPLVVDENASDNGVLHEMQIAGRRGLRNQVIRGIEETRGVTALAASPAVVASRPPAGIACPYCQACRHARPLRRPGGLLDQLLPAAHRGRRLVVLAPRKPGQILGSAADPDQPLDAIVIRGEIGIAEGPRDLPSVALGFCQVEVRIAEREASPDVGLSADSPNACQ